MKAYSIFLFLFTLGLVLGAINELGIYDVKLPQSNVQTVSQANVMDLSNTATNAGLNPFFIFFVIQSFMKVLGTGLLTCATILPLMMGFGVPLVIAMMFQAPVWIVEAFGIYQLITGYNMGGME